MRMFASMENLLKESVCAVVVTYNRKALLEECLAALQDQTRHVDHILVVDNASTDGTAEGLRAEHPHVELLLLPANVGGAGGFHEGVKVAFEGGFDWIWLMDDDGRPSPDCLEQLLARRQDCAALVPIQQNSRGDLYGISVWKGMDVNTTEEIVEGRVPTEGDYVFAFVGPLVSRGIVERVGLPNKDFFIWYDDIEYALRIMALPEGRIIVVPDAVFFHDYGGVAREVSFLGRKSLRSSQPAWKAYYSARNPLYIVTRVKKSFRDFATYARTQLRFAVGELLYEPDRWSRLALRARGCVDGALGRMGKRVSP